MSHNLARRLIVVALLLLALPAPAESAARSHVSPNGCLAPIVSLHQRWTGNPEHVRRVLGARGLVQEISQGGEAVAYLVEGSPSLVARVLQQGRGGRTIAELVRREAQMLQDIAATRHAGASHVVTVHSTHPEEGVITMPLILGAAPIDRYIQLRRATPAQVLGLTRQALLALEAVHEAGIVHRDLKPENVLVSPDGHVTLIDFGIAIRQAEAANLRNTAGTDGYFPPSVLRINRPSHDVYGLQKTLRDMVLAMPDAEQGTPFARMLLTIAHLPNVTTIAELRQYLLAAENNVTTPNAFYGVIRGEIARYAINDPWSAAEVISNDPELARQFIANPRLLGFDAVTLEGVADSLSRLRQHTRDAPLLARLEEMVVAYDELFPRAPAPRRWWSPLRLFGR